MDYDKLAKSELPIVEAPFDNEVVVIADSEFDERRSFQVILTTSAGDQSFTVNRVLMDVMDYKSQIKALCLKASEDGLDENEFEELEKCNRKSNYYYQLLKEGLDSVLIESILEGRNRLAFLIDSFGGDGSVSDKYANVINLVKANNGLTQGFVTGTAASAAFQVVMDCEDVYALKKSSLNWHYSKDKDEGKKFSYEEQEEEFDELVKFLDKGNGELRNELLKRVNKTVNSPDNYDGDVFFTGQELARAGCISYYFNNIKGMSKFFARNYLAAGHSAINDFWILSRDAIQSVSGRTDWHDVGFEELRAQAVQRRAKPTESK